MFERRTEFVDNFQLDKMFFGPGPRPDMSSKNPQFFFLKYFPSLRNPQFVPADRASHMRGIDRVIGLTHNGISRAYPLWIMDNYHGCNDMIGQTPLAVNHCEKCGSGGAFIARHQGNHLTFENPGIYNAGLTTRDDQTGSFWNHFEGVAIYGPLKGAILQYVPCYQCTWAEWVDLHPDTEVLLYPPDNPIHWDGRHGHGAEEDLGSRGLGTGLGPFFVRTLSGPLDTRLPEHVAVLGVNISDGVKAYPLAEVQRSGCLVNDRLGDEPIVVFLRAPNSHLMAAYSRRIHDRVLKFDRAGRDVVDKQTSSLWTIEGRAIEGPLKGASLSPLNWSFIKWHSWALYHPETELYRSDAPEARGVELGAYKPVIQGLKEAGYSVELVNEMPRVLLPQQAERGLVLRIGGDLIRLYRFETIDAAEDYDQLEKHTLPVGSFVFKSDPEKQFADIYQNKLLPDDQIAWSPLLDEAGFLETVTRTVCGPDGPSERGIVGFLHELENAGYAVGPSRPVPLDSLPVGSLRGISTTINGDPFLVYKFSTIESAEAFVGERQHSLHIGRMVFQSDPADRYEYPHFGTGNRPEDEVTWSSLPRDERFVAALRAIAG